MADLEEEFNLEVPCEKVLLRTNAHNDKITIGTISLTPAQAASIAWLGNHPEGTLLSIQIKIKS